MREEPDPDLRPSSPVERAMVARGWADVDLAERSGTQGTARAMSARLAAEKARALAWYDPPVADMVGPRMRAMYEGEANVTRYRKTVDYLKHGEVVYEVGIGRGFLATTMMRGAGLRGYRGVDLVARNVTATRAMLQANGLAEQADVREQDLYDLTRADVEEIGATLLVCCEVIEHTPDPELALRTLAQALPEGTDLLWSVPLLGRLEKVWGHTAIFGAARLQRMMADAGLIAHHVETVANTWVFVLASRTPDPSPRADSAVAGVTAPALIDLVESPVRSVTNIPPGSLERAASRWTHRVEAADVAGPPDGALRVRARGTAGGERSSYAGVAFTCPPDVVGARVEVTVPVPERMRSLHVEFRRDGQRTGRWNWDYARSSPVASEKTTFVVRPGPRGVHMRLAEGDSVGADTVEVFARAADTDGLIDFTLERWGWVR